MSAISELANIGELRSSSSAPFAYSHTINKDTQIKVPGCL